MSRIREHVAGGAWCPAEPVSKDSTEYLEVDLGRLMVVTMVETQGRFDNGQVGITTITTTTTTTTTTTNNSNNFRNSRPIRTSRMLCAKL